MHIRTSSLIHFAFVVAVAAQLPIAKAQSSAAPEGPDPREIPLPEIVGPMGRLPGVGELPVRKELPNVLTFNDGTFSFRTTRFYPAYPGYDWGILAGWAWGASRVADYLETDSAIDHTKLMIITGASRSGKSAMVAAAFDERLLGAPVVTGGGGVGAYRFAGPGNSETLDLMEKKYPNWFSPRLHEFWGHREKLPFDQHWFLALCAPRPFLALEDDADTISLPEAVKQSILAAKPAYALFGAEDKLGVNYAHHAHAFTNDDWTAMMDFADKNLRGLKVARAFDRFPTEAELDAVRAVPPLLTAPASK